MYIRDRMYRYMIEILYKYSNISRYLWVDKKDRK